MAGFQGRRYATRVNALQQISPGSLLAEFNSALKNKAPDTTPSNRQVANTPVQFKYQGNIDLLNRPQVKNPDGSISTVRSMSFNDNGLEVVIPTVSDDGKLLSDDDAIKLYYQTGRHLGKYKTVKEAVDAAEAIHKQQEEQLNKRNK